MRRNPYTKWSSSGFTIIELLIATAVFTVLLLVITSGVLQFTHQYYRGVIASQTQNVARQLINNVAQAIQFSPGSATTTVSNLYKLNALSPPSATPIGYCIGQTQRYSFKLDQQVTPATPYGPHQGAHALISDSTSGCTTATFALDAGNVNVLTNPDPNTSPPHAPINARELLGAHMRITKFDIVPVTDGSMTNAYTIRVRVIYGDDDLLDNPSSPDAACKSQVGDQFCAAAEYATTVKKRVD